MAATIKIHDLTFDESTGEVSRAQEGHLQPLGRLAPQPAKLLALLVTSHPEITTHEAIQQTLWPGVADNYDKNIHFCVRQIRSVLGDLASQPSYIQTIPRRGYRFVEGIEIGQITPDSSEPTIDCELADGGADASPEAESAETVDPTPGSSAGHESRPTAWRTVAIWGTLIAAVPFALLLWQNSLGPPPVRVAVMTFEPVALDTTASAKNDIAELLVESLTRDRELGLLVVGPTTTIDFEGQPQLLQELQQAHAIDYVINGRFSDRNEEFVLAEIIRSTDGVHVWVNQFAWRKNQPQIAQAIVTGLRDVLSGKTNRPVH